MSEQRYVLLEIHDMMKAISKSGSKPKGVLLGKVETRELANMEPESILARLQKMGLELKFTNEEEQLEVW